MSPSQLITNDHRSQHKIMNSRRPSALNVVNKTSHLIHKPSSSLPILPTNRQHRQPVIIYTRSPKIIHTEARNFMALVQRLTGMSQPNDSPSANHLVLDGKHSEIQTPSCHFVEESRGVGGIEPDPVMISDAPLPTPASHYRFL